MGEKTVSSGFLIHRIRLIEFPISISIAKIPIHMFRSAQNSQILGRSEHVSWNFFWPNHVHEKFQRNPSVGRGLKIFIFRPYGFDYLGFLTNAHRGAMRSKTRWVFYRDLEWWPGPQKVQFWKTTGYPEVVGLIFALLMLYTFGWQL